MAGYTKSGIVKKYPQLEELYGYCEKTSLRLHPAQKALIERTASVPLCNMLGDSAQIQFLQNIAQMINAKKTLDVGVFTGYSALSIAMVLPGDGRVVALDVSEEYTNIGKPYFKEAGVEHKIDLRINPAEQSLRELIANGECGTFDLAFVDADKEGYDTYYECILQLLRPGGVIMFDNMFQYGKCLDETETNPAAVSLRNLAHKLHKDERVNVSFLVQGDGTYLVFKK